MHFSTRLFKIRQLGIQLSFLMALFCMGQIPLSAQTLVWEENFDAATLNPNYWTYDFGDGCERALCGWGNSELEYYTSRPENVRIENGVLIIEARKESFSNSAFTSGRVKTEGRMHFKYGTLEARIKVPDVKNGLWPAFWTLGTVGGVWPKIGEIDIMEMGAQAALQASLGNKRVTAAVHYDNNGAKGDSVARFDSPVDLSDDYHLYKLVWNSSTVSMYIDNQKYFSFDITTPAAKSREEFHQPHFILMNLAVGGSYPGIYNSAEITAPLPGKMLVDYVKLYQNAGDELIMGNDQAKSGNFGILTETTPVSDSLSFGKNANLYYWNNLANITIPAPVPFEGNSLLALHANANDWFGFGIDNNYVNLNNFATGSLKFNFKSNYAGQFKIGIKTGHGESWMNFAAGTQKYGLLRDGSWHQVTIPMADFNNGALGMNIDLLSVKGAFMFAGDPGTAADFYFDDIYYTGGAPANSPPTVALTAPANNAIFTTTDNITLTADAADANGAIAQVAFYSGNTLLGTDNSSPYSYTRSGSVAKVDTLTAKATDNEGAVTTSAPVIIFVAAPGNVAPSAAIAAPANLASFLTPSSVTITANVTDADGSIYKVEFFNGATLLGTSTASPYSYTMTSPVAGAYALSVRATDNGGLTTASAVVNITLADPVKPTVSITSPANNSNFAPPATITIQADAADINGTVTRVDFYNGSNLLGSDNSSPYSYTWSSVPLGNYTLTAKATDNDGNTTVSTPVAIIVKPVACTGLAVNGDYSYEVYSSGGSVLFTLHPLSPIAGSSSAIIYIKEGVSAGAYAGYTMTKSGSDFVYSKAIANSTFTSFYFSYSVPSGGERNSMDNPHTYTAGAVCVAGAPNVTITSPAEASTYTAPASITITANASDADGTIASVEFYSGATLIGSDNSSPYSFTWTNVAAASYSLTAKAIDNAGLTNTSYPINVVVNAPNTNGYCGTAFSKDYDFKASTSNGIVTFILHPLTPILGSKYAFIYVREGLSGGYPGYTMTQAGPDFIFTKAIANATPVSFYFTYQVPTGGERNSSANPHSYTVGANCTGISGTPPAISITSPANNASVTETAAFTVTATATDADGSITKVEFYSGATLLGQDATSPYSVDWTNVPAGNYDIIAKATDNSGFTTLSSLVRVVVNINNAAGFCATVANGDYSYKAETIGGNVVFSLHPLTPIAGCSYALIYVREGLSGGYPGYNMTAIGTDFRFTKAISNGTPLSIYFTYQVPAGGERNSSLTPHSYTTGSTCIGQSLPVSLTAFTATLQSDGSIGLSWTTATELNNAYFVVERSVDGQTFSALDKVVSKGNSTQAQSYNFQDKWPASGINYYRLTQVDVDGKKTVSGIKTLTISGRNTAVSLYPNPLTGHSVTVLLPGIHLQQLQVKLLTMAGKEIYRAKVLPQGNTLQVNFNHRPAAGIYLLNVEGQSPLKLVVN